MKPSEPTSSEPDAEIDDGPTVELDPAGRVPRFAAAPRWAHWSTAVVMGSCLATAAVLYLAPLSELVGRRQLVATIHLYSGLALPVPMLVATGSAAYRRDVRALNRFSPADWAWLRASLRLRSWTRARARARVAGGIGKFNAGQKLFASFTAGAILVMLGTGAIMQWGNGPLRFLPLSYRTGATFVHDLLAYGLFFGVAGHLWMAYHDPVARLGMRTGVVPAWWAAREHPAWRPEAPPQAGRAGQGWKR